MVIHKIFIYMVELERLCLAIIEARNSNKTHNCVTASATAPAMIVRSDPNE